MRPPHEETWERDGMDLVFPTENGNDPNRYRLAACAPEMARMLLANEFVVSGECMGCAFDSSVGHPDWCPWLLLMKKAGIR